MKTKEQIKKWFREHSVLEKDAWCIYGFLLGKEDYDYVFAWHTESNKKQYTYKSFIGWYNDPTQTEYAFEYV